MDLNVASIKAWSIRINDFIGFYCLGGELMLYLKKKKELFGKRIPIAVASER